MESLDDPDELDAHRRAWRCVLEVAYRAVGSIRGHLLLRTAQITGGLATLAGVAVSQFDLLPAVATGQIVGFIGLAAMVTSRLWLSVYARRLEQLGSLIVEADARLDSLQQRATALARQSAASAGERSPRV